MAEPTRGPPGPSRRSVERLSRVVDEDVALYALNESIIRDEPILKLVVCEKESLRASLVYRYDAPLLEEDSDRLRLLGVCLEGIGEPPGEVRDTPAEDILYYRSAGGLWVVVLDEPNEEKAVEIVRRICGSYTRRPRIMTGLELTEVC
ncbi:hypothetical protein Pyrfu_1731 [Pyrolobus fumarii 1A]|uniref:Uncharacterized protein n=1 Tax=Pyrolobus fumarii (strain DSM 11204 / 1A) TaxID=694429 RepID=G0ECL6_PYRF1|nr:hypothetical protein [Pyrolobus fumarii]AEM39586.1 hypothetical protein Pyrfu_1731 [Pyrolobus fumarii 1A]